LPSKLSIFGLILLLLGAIFLGVGEFNLRNVNSVEVEHEDTVWSHAANLTHGITYGVDISASDDWGKPFGKGDFTKAMPVNVTITSPRGDVTSLQVFYYGEASTSPFYQVGIPPAIVAVKYENVDSAGLLVDTSSYHMRFMARQDGPYNVTVLQEGLWSKEPPDYILFSKEVTPNSGIYYLLSAAGGVMCALGGVTYLVTLFRSRNSSHKSRK
jgi:hypothetical protein